ncbi:hypothetical protein YTPLAS18_34560 [Nitrospira sp.]|nr:hypothetical protein YTPLAS18_34560 [Nitrospira sp.]
MITADGREIYALKCRGMLIGMVVFGALTLLGQNYCVLAASDSPVVLPGAQSGTVTAVHQSSFDINGRSYQLAPDAVIVDPQGKLLEPSAIRELVEVQFLVTRQQPNKIVKIVLYLPR